MFRPDTRLKKKSFVGPLDPEKQYELQEFGCYIGEDDALMLIDEPGEKYRYRLKKPNDHELGRYSAEQYNDRLWLVITKALFRIIVSRFADLGVHPLTLPLGTPKDQPHIDIFVSDEYSVKSSLTVALPDGGEAGVWTSRLLSQCSIREGSMENLIKHCREADQEIVIANPTQLIWHEGKALSVHQYNCTGGKKMSRVNRIPENENQTAHIESVLTTVVTPAAAKKISFIAVGLSACALLVHLNREWSSWKHRVSVVVLICSCHTKSDFTNTEFQKFLQTNCIHFYCSHLPVKTILVDDDRFAVPCISGGHEMAECLPATCLPAAFEFIKSIAQDENMQFIEPEESPEPELIWDENMNQVLASDLPVRKEWGRPLPAQMPLTPEETRLIAGRV